MLLRAHRADLQPDRADHHHDQDTDQAPDHGFQGSEVREREVRAREPQHQRHQYRADEGQEPALFEQSQHGQKPPRCTISTRRLLGAVLRQIRRRIARLIRTAADGLEPAGAAHGAAEQRHHSKRARPG